MRARRPDILGRGGDVQQIGHARGLAPLPGMKSRSSGSGPARRSNMTMRLVEPSNAGIGVLRRDATDDAIVGADAHGRGEGPLLR